MGSRLAELKKRDFGKILDDGKSLEGEKYDQTTHTNVPHPVMEVIKPILKDLVSSELLRKCLLDKTRNLYSIIRLLRQKLYL
ncbi:hypothetical protein CEXT_330601 [Caerostris extrusa]|uniref:Uncharacterized protein n=1 Tax=Caerostris extrusa TaxID=172846 RepID=A0AAV4M7A1_CAEEX|nr:hypothetical protein CEXT_330601 [Caerostris extrusa]